MSSLEKFRKKNEKFAERMSRKTHFTEVEIVRLVDIQKRAMVGQVMLYTSINIYFYRMVKSSQQRHTYKHEEEKTF